MRGWSRWALIASVSLNLFLAAVLFARPHPPPHPPNLDHIVDRMAEPLPAADAKILRDTFEPRRAELLRMDMGMHSLPALMQHILQDPEFNGAALLAAFEEATRIHSHFDGTMAQIVVEAAGRMSPEGRRKLWAFPGPPPPPP